MDWKCYMCGKDAVAVGVAVKKVYYQTRNSFHVNDVYIKGWSSLEGDCEFIPCCEEHDFKDRNNFVLRCELDPTIKVKMEAILADREIEL